MGIAVALSHVAPRHQLDRGPDLGCPDGRRHDHILSAHCTVLHREPVRQPHRGAAAPPFGAQHLPSPCLPSRCCGSRHRDDLGARPRRHTRSDVTESALLGSPRQEAHVPYCHIAPPGWIADVAYSSDRKRRRHERSWERREARERPASAVCDRDPERTRDRRSAFERFRSLARSSCDRLHEHAPARTPDFRHLRSASARSTRHRKTFCVSVLGVGTSF
jgi:hypothetical protein